MSDDGTSVFETQTVTQLEDMLLRVVVLPHRVLIKLPTIESSFDVVGACNCGGDGLRDHEFVPALELVFDFFIKAAFCTNFNILC
jgi:hypothetical protein